MTLKIEVNKGCFISSIGSLNYKRVLDDFINAKIIRIITYNISRFNISDDFLFKLLQKSKADIKIITNIPSRMKNYYKNKAGQMMRETAQNNIQIYANKLNPLNFSEHFSAFFNPKVHAKMIGTENIVYIGSANFSNESANNIENGVLIEDKEFIENLYSEYFSMIESESVPIYDDSFSQFMMLASYLYERLTWYYQYFDKNLSNYIEIDNFDFEIFYADLLKLQSLIEDVKKITHDETDIDYTNELDNIINELKNLKIDLHQENLSKLVNYDIGKESEKILQEEYILDANEENLENYVLRSMEGAKGKFSDMCSDFLYEISTIISVLDDAIKFAKKWRYKKINPMIDNTEL